MTTETPTLTEHRANLADRLDKAADALADMLGYWIDHDLAADVLAGEEYPFTRSLDDLVAEVQHAVETIRAHNDAEEDS